MLQRIERLIFLLFVLAGAAKLSAQAQRSEIGVWAVDTRWTNTTLGPENTDRSGQFDENRGYGVSFNRFWTDRLSTEIAVQKFSAGAVLGGHSVEGEVFSHEGEIDVTAGSLVAQWHFNRTGRFAPYLGAGIARMSARFESHDTFELQSFDYDTVLPPTAVAGANVRVTERMFVAGEVKYIPWSADRVEIDPLVFGAGVKLRF